MDKKHHATILQRRLRNKRDKHEALAPTPCTRALRHPTATRSYRDTKHVQGVMLERPTELLVSDKSLPINRPRSRLPTQNPVSKCVLCNVAPRSCPCMCFGSETVRVTAKLSLRFFSFFEFCRPIAVYHLARPPPFYTRMRTAVPCFRVFERCTLKLGGEKGGGSFKMNFQIVNIESPNAPQNSCVQNF